MNSKGSFSAIVAVSLVVLIAAIGFTFYSNGVSQKALLEQQDSLELRNQWAQTRFLLDKAAAKALLEHTVYAGTCTVYSFDSASVSAYFTTVLNNTKSSVICGIPASGAGSLNVTSPSNIAFKLTCSKAGLSYSDSVIFEKEVRAGTGCEVWDIQGDAFKDV